MFIVYLVRVLQACAEADTFFCFVELLSGFRDHFCQQLDNSVVGIRATITRLSRLLKEHDEELWRHLEVTTKVRFFCTLIGKKNCLPFEFTALDESINKYMVLDMYRVDFPHEMVYLLFCWLSSIRCCQS